jgi:4-amino-4-deoxy-L-arabinose transferase-like glycosyltransferase
MASPLTFDENRSPGVNIFRHLITLLGLGFCLFVCLLSIFWVGFIGSDDALYWRSATGWLTEFPLVGGDHWSLRHTVVIPIALGRLIFGDGMVAMVSPTLLYAFGLIAVLAIWTWRAGGPRSAVAAIALIVTAPQMVLLSSTANVDLAEVFFIMSGFFVLNQVLDRAKVQDLIDVKNGVALWLLLLVGAFLGMAMISRETTVFAIATIGVLFLTGYGMDRRFYLLIGVGFIAIVGLDFAYLWSMTGKLLYRFTIDVNHDTNINRWADQGAAIPLVHPIIDPVVMLFLNHHFGFLAWIGIPLVIWLVRSGPTGSVRRMMALLGTLTLMWAVLAAGLWRLLPLIPRYYLLPSVGISVLSGIALAQIWQRGRTGVAALIGVLMVSGNLLALSADNRNFMFGEYTLVELASRDNRTIHTDPQTLRRADLLLEWRQVRDHVTSTPPGTDDLFFYNPTRIDPNRQPGPNWGVVDRRDVPEAGGRWLACHLPVNMIPSTMLGRLGCGKVSVILYRVP